MAIQFNSIQYAPIAQGASGTLTIAAAVAGQRHKLLGFILSLANDGTIRFASNATSLTGNIKIDGQLQPVAYGPSEIPIAQSAVGEALNLVTTQPAQGVAMYITEP